MIFTAFLLSQVSASAYLVFDRKITVDQAKVGKPVNVYVNILNLGDSAATDLVLSEAGIPREMFEYKDDAQNLNWKELKPGHNITHVFTVSPKVAGNLHMGKATLLYRDGAEQRKILSSEVFWLLASNARSIGQTFNMAGYMVFILAAAVAVVVPFLFWFMTRNVVNKKD